MGTHLSHIRCAGYKLYTLASDSTVGEEAGASGRTRKDQVRPFPQAAVCRNTLAPMYTNTNVSACAPGRPRSGTSPDSGRHLTPVHGLHVDCRPPTAPPPQAPREAHGVMTIRRPRP